METFLAPLGIFEPGAQTHLERAAVEQASRPADLAASLGDSVVGGTFFG